MKNSAIERWKEGQAERQAAMGRGGKQRGTGRDQIREEGDTDQRAWHSLCVLFSALPREFYNSDISLYHFLFCTSGHLTNIHIRK